MDDDEDTYAITIYNLEEDIDAAVSRALSGGMTRDEIYKEVRRLAQEWKDSE